MLQHQNITIPATLQPFIRHIWTMDAANAGTTGSSFSVYADGCPGILFQQAEQGLTLNQDKKPAPVFLYGQTVQPICMSTESRLKMVVINFHPHVLQPIFRFSAKEVTDDCLDLSLLPPVPRINLTEQLWNTASPENQVNVLFDYMEQLVARNKATVDKGMAYATSQIAKTNGACSLKELQRALNLGERTFERKFEQYIGIPPKLFSKIAQFQAALSQMRNKKFHKLSDIAYDNGYADQSHFIRNFKKFTGLSPFGFQKQTANIHDNFPALIS